MNRKIVIWLKSWLKSFSNRGSIFTETVMRIGLVVIIGGLLITLLSTIIPDLFNDLVTKIRTVFQITG